MSWCETLGATHSTEKPYTYDAQKSTKQGNFADIADSACRYSVENDSKHLEALAEACLGLFISPAEVRMALAAEDIEDWRKGKISIDTLSAYTSSLVQRRVIVPDNYAERAICRQCGPVWLWFSGEAQCCPWCWNRAAGKPIPRP